MTVRVDAQELEEKVQQMYRAVATEPHLDYHFERARDTSAKYGVKSVSLLARKERW